MNLLLHHRHENYASLGKLRQMVLQLPAYDGNLFCLFAVGVGIVVVGLVVRFVVVRAVSRLTGSLHRDWLDSSSSTLGLILHARGASLLT